MDELFEMHDVDRLMINGMVEWFKYNYRDKQIVKRDGRIRDRVRNRYLRFMLGLICEQSMEDVFVGDLQCIVDGQIQDDSVSLQIVMIIEYIVKNDSVNDNSGVI